jgi:hypothetical protein
VEINSASFTKLLQAHTYNILHTSAACRKTFLYECLDPWNGVISTRVIDYRHVAILLQETSQGRCQSTTLFYFSKVDLLIVGPSNTHTKLLRQTDGERFFAGREHVEFAEEFSTRRRRVRDTWDTRSITRA